MKILSLFYAIPAIVFLVIAGLWYLRRGLPRLLAVLPVLVCYLMAGTLLFLGGCRPMAHVILDGVEIDLVDGVGNPREISIGAQPESGLMPCLEIPNYPEDALRLSITQEGLQLKPGGGYQRGLLVRDANGALIPLEPSGLPRLVEVQGGDSFHIQPQAGGDVLVQWRLGNGTFDLTPPTSGDYRWIGTEGSGVARLADTAPQIIGIRSRDGLLKLKKAAGLEAGLGVTVNGIRVVFNGEGEATAPYQPGKTLLALVQADAASGVIQFTESGLFRFNATLDWTSTKSDPPIGFPVTLEVGKSYRVGGAVEDDFFVRGLPSGGLTLQVSREGLLSLDLTESGKEAVERRELSGNYPIETTSLGESVTLGSEADPGGGRFFIPTSKADSAKPVSPATASPLATAVELTSTGPASAGPGTSGVDDSSDVTVAPADGSTAETPNALGKTSWSVVWMPNSRTSWVLPNRRIIVPLINFEIGLGQRRAWGQQVFSLGAVTPRASTLYSSIVYGQPHSAGINGANLLLMEPGLQIQRGGTPVALAALPAGKLPKSGSLDFLLVQADEQGGRFGAVFGTPFSPARVWEARRVALQKKFSSFELRTRVVGKDRSARTIPYLYVRYQKPIIQAIPLAEVKDDIRGIDPKAANVSFGLNDQSGVSKHANQIFFPSIGRSFSSANADIDLAWLSFTTQDDYRRQSELEYGEDFMVGDDRRLLLRINHHGRPLGLLVQVGIVTLLGTAACAWGAASFGWVSLTFGAAFLTCSRILFGQAAIVNPPHNSEVLSSALIAFWIVPLFLLISLVIGKQLLPGRIEHLLTRIEAWITFRKLALIAITGFVVRVILLALGFKEAIGLGSFRVALSIAFVPFYLTLFSLACFILWREKRIIGNLSWSLLGPFILCTLILSACQALAAILVSDLGLMLYFIPQAIVLAGLGLIAGIENGLRWLRHVSGDKEKPWHILAGALLPTVPLALIAIVFLAPQWLMGVIPGMSDKLVNEHELVTDSTLLRVLQFTNKDYLLNLGTDTAERIAQDHAIMENYAHRGLLGEGYLKVNVTPAKSVTALNDNVSAVFVLAQFGVVGGIAIVVAYLAIGIAGGSRTDDRHSFTTWLALLAGLSFCLVSIYMIAANYGLLPFTGRNMYLLGLNSLSDIVESLALLGLIVLHHARTEFHEEDESTQNAAQLDLQALVNPPPSDAGTV